MVRVLYRQYDEMKILLGRPNHWSLLFFLLVGQTFCTNYIQIWKEFVQIVEKFRLCKFNVSFCKICDTIALLADDIISIDGKER